MSYRMSFYEIYFLDNDEVTWLDKGDKLPEATTSNKDEWNNYIKLESSGEK